VATGKRGAAQKITTAERRIQALAYRKGGASYRAIAENLGVDVHTAWEYVAAGLAELAAEQRAEAAELRALEAARLDDLQRAVWPRAIMGSLEAVKVALRILERRARLLGLDLQPGELLPGETAIILRWHDGRNIIDVTPPAAGDQLAAAASLAEPDRDAPGAVSYRVRWETLGQEPAGSDAEPEDGAA
jgi:hypothetical protein